MEKLEKIFNNYKGVIIFYIIVALLALLLTKRIEDINSGITNEVETEKSYYA